ncbi:MAG: hypothetical protein JJU36_08990 [Phycisphaeraceae bacterium]|nr:hypothetical protein [Phycisphaeraceae bacterium]
MPSTAAKIGFEDRLWAAADKQHQTFRVSGPRDTLLQKRLNAAVNLPGVEAVGEESA